MRLAQDSTDPQFVLNSLMAWNNSYVNGLRVFGSLSGTYFMILALCMLFVFRKMFALIDSGHKLSETLQHQKHGLRLMMVLVVISYFVAALINYFYGLYRKEIDIFWRWLLYELVGIVI
jgi:hypothetical protein